MKLTAQFTTPEYTGEDGADFPTTFSVEIDKDDPSVGQFTTMFRHILMAIGYPDDQISKAVGDCE